MRNANLKAMIIDDQESMRSIVRGLLHQIGIDNVIEAESGESALDLLIKPENAPDFIVCDLYMEKGDGLQFANSLRRHERARSVPIILLTGERDQMILDVTRQSGVAAILTKPCTAEQLSSAVSRAIGFELALAASAI